MVIGGLGVPGEAVLKHADLEQGIDIGGATTLLQGMAGNTALDQAAGQELATHKLVQVNLNHYKKKLIIKAHTHMNFGFVLTYPNNTVLVCVNGWKYFAKTRKCYKYSSVERTRADSIRLSCKAATDNPTANLVSIRDMDTNNYVNSLSKGKFWIGAYKSSGGWLWPDGYKAIVTNWAKDQPSGDGSYAEVLDDYGTWNDLNAGYKRASVCQYDPKGKFSVLQTHRT